MGYARAITVLERPFWSFHVRRLDFVATPTDRRQARRKLLASAMRWKPTRSEPSRPSTTRRAQGSWAKISYGGNGMWLK